jgi:hypothetical protein
VMQIIAAVILAQTLFFKFTAAPEPVHIFTTLGVEPWGRLFAAVSELIASILLLVPRTRVLGAVMSIGVMLGAIGAHLGPLGIEVLGDKGLLFAMAIVVLLCSVGVVVIRRCELRAWIDLALRLIPARR